jgi:hypothetical protein
MRRFAWLILLPLLDVAACAPQQVGEQVGQSLYKASVGTGQAIATVGDKTGQALQNAGSSLRGTASPPQPVTPPPFYAPPGYSADPGYAPPGAVTQEKLGY